MAMMIEVNLLPIEYRVVRKDMSYLTDRRVVWTSLLVLVAIVGVWLHFMSLVASKASKEDRIAELHTEIAKYDTVKTQIKELEDLKSRQEAKNISLRSISVSKKRWVRVMEDINASLPPHTWILSIKESDEGADKVTIVARTFVFQEVAGFMLQLERQPFFLAPALENIEQVKVDMSSTPAFAFTLHCPLDPAIHQDNAATTGDSLGRTN